MKLRDIPRIILADSLIPLSAKEIWVEAVKRGLDKVVASKGKTPDASIGAFLYTEAKREGSGIVAEGTKPIRFRLSNGGNALCGTKPIVAHTSVSSSGPTNTITSKSITAGYVYILTNPYMKGIVKIGKTRRPVNTRSKELFNTAIPAEFVEFASLKTSKFAQVEELVHRILTKLTRKRVNEKREFYKIKPQNAFEILKDVSILLEEDDCCFHNPGQEFDVMRCKKRKKQKTTIKATIQPRQIKKSVFKWVGKTQLARMLARRGGNEGAYGGILHFFNRKRPCVKKGKWRKLLENAGIKFDSDDYVIDWSVAKNPL